MGRASRTKRARAQGRGYQPVMQNPSRSILVWVIAFICSVIIVSIALDAHAAGDGVKQNLSGNSIADMAAIMTSGGDEYNTLEDGDTFEVVVAGSTRSTTKYIFDIDSGQTETSDNYIQPDEISSGVSYTGSGRWVKMSAVFQSITTGSLNISKQPGAAGDIGLYEANSTDTDTAGFRGPASLTANTSYRGQFPNARPTAAGAIAAWGTSSAGDGTPSSPYIHAWSWIYLDDTGTNGDTGKFWSADKNYDELALKAPLASPTFTGTPAGPTAAADTNTTQLATTAFVLGQAYTSTPAMDGTAAAGSAARFSRGDHVHPSDTSRAAIVTGANPTVDAATKIGVDTSATSGGMIRVYTDAERAVPIYLTKEWTIKAADAASDYSVWKVPYAITLRRVSYLQVGATNWVGQVQEAGSDGTGGADTQSADSTVTGSTDVTSFSNASLDADDYLAIKTTSVSGTNTYVTVTVLYTVDPVN